MISIVIFIFGLIVGSFLNCLIYRLEIKELSSSRGAKLTKEGAKLRPGSLAPSFIKGRSFCPHCKHTLSWKDLIPVLSFLILGGRCRYCQKKISWQYPFVEIATGLLFLLIFNFQFSIFNFKTIAELFYLLVISSLLIIIFVFDLKHYIIPDKVIYPAILIVLVFRIWGLFRISNFEFRIFMPFIAAFASAGFFLFIVLISRGKWMGVGDIKLAFLMGLFLGFPNVLVALFSAFLIGAIIGIGLIGAKLKTLKSEVPFGPFLVTGTFIALFWGKEIIRWYLDLFI